MSGFEPKILVFACNWCSYAGADMAGVSRFQMPPNCRVIRVMCSARVRPEQVVAALTQGLDGVLVLGCHPGDCHYVEGNYHTRRRSLLLARLLHTMGIDPGRFAVRWVSAAEGAKFADTIRQTVDQIQKIGPNPLCADPERGPEPLPDPVEAVRIPFDAPATDRVQEALRAEAAQFLKQSEAACFIGWEDSPLQPGTRPVIIRDAADVGKLVWSVECRTNPAAYLPRYREKPGKVGVAVKGCDARGLRLLLDANQIPREKVFALGVPCQGLVLGGGLDPRCPGCRFPEGFEYDATLGPMESPALPAPGDRADLLGGLTLEQRFRFFKTELDKCIRCDACRKICYGCYCPQCIFEHQKPRWLNGRHDFAGKFFFHAVRAYHLAGRCIGCDECLRACPAGVRLDLLNRSLAQCAAELFDYPEAGMTPAPLPLRTFSTNDPDPFSLEAGVEPDPEVGP